MTFFAIYFCSAIIGALIISFTDMQNYWGYIAGFIVYGVINIAEQVYLHGERQKIGKDKNGNA